MAEPQNLANAIILIGCTYFMINFDFGIGIAIMIGGFLIFSIATWAHWHQTEDEKTLVRLGIKQATANIQNLNAATAIAIANTKLIARQLQ